MEIQIIHSQKKPKTNIFASCLVNTWFCISGM